MTTSAESQSPESQRRELGGAEEALVRAGGSIKSGGPVDLVISSSNQGTKRGEAVIGNVHLPQPPMGDATIDTNPKSSPMSSAKAGVLSF